jgi:phenylalanyl-tRNA synthetase beta chain
VLGALHPNVEEELALSEPNCLFELDLEKLLPYSPPRLAFRGLPRFPAVVRDLALVGDQDFSSSRVVEFIREWRSELVEEVALFDEYVGAPIPPGKKSLAYSISYRASDRTLTDEEVNALHSDLTAALQKALPVELRQ